MNLLVDCREFIQDKFTGIGRVLEGLVDALVEHIAFNMIILAIFDSNALPSSLKPKPKIKLIKIPQHFLKSEKAISDLTKKEAALFISPYPKLPLFGCHCKSVHIIHDVLDLTHPLYRKRFKALFDSWRLKRALKKTDLTWYDSSWSLEETKKYVGFVGKDPKVRYPGISEKFNINREKKQNEVLNKYHIQSGYVLVVGNGLPHKNLGIILEITNHLSRKVVFAGVPQKNQHYWHKRYPEHGVTWINHVAGDDLPFLIKGSFCLVQPSKIEGYGYPPLEAMACGIPVIISNIPVLKETTGSNTLIADPNNPKEWKAAIEGLENHNIYKNQIEKGLKWVEPIRGRKGWEKHISDLEDLFRSE